MHLIAEFIFVSKWYKKNYFYSGNCGQSLFVSSAQNLCSHRLQCTNSATPPYNNVGKFWEEKKTYSCSSFEESVSVRVKA